jgi:hypothetical protein
MLFSVLGTSISSSEFQSVREKIIGVWLDKYLVKNPNPSGIRDRYLWENEERLTITQEGKKIFLTSNKGRSNRSELIEVPAQPGEKRRFNEKNSRDLNMDHLLRKMLEEAQEAFKAGKEAKWLDVFFTGNYYIIDANDNLDLYDKNGYVREAKKIG